MSIDSVMFCRLCLREGNLLPLNEAEMKNKISKCANINISDDSGFQSLICLTCIGKMHVAYDFKVQCENSDRKLKKYFQLRNENINLSNEELKCFFEMDFEEKNCAEGNLYDKENSKLNVRNKKEGKRSTITSKQLYSNENIDEIDDTDDQKLHITKSSIECLNGENFKFIIKNEPDINDNDKTNERGSKYKLLIEKSVHLESKSERLKKPPVKKRQGRPKSILDSLGKKTKYMCELCGKSFTKKETLRGHIRRHTGEKPYVCSNCGKSFHVANELRKHTMVHTGKKPYQCSFCAKCFSDWGSRNKHERIHKGEKPYMCDMCPKKFAYSYVLSRHKLTHSGTKDHMCNICQKRFALKCHLDKHMKRHLKYEKVDIISTNEPTNEIIVCDMDSMIPVKIVPFVSSDSK